MEAVLNVFVSMGSIWDCEKMMNDFLLNTGSTIEEGRLAKGGCKLTEDYMDECAVCEMNSGDYARLGLPEKVRVATRDGRYSVVVHSKASDSVMSGHVFMPRSIWANVVVEPETFSTGSPLYKGFPVIIEPTEDQVVSAEELVLRLYVGSGK